MTFGDMTIDILTRTRDGNDLDPRDLKLVELAVNGVLNESGEVAFADLHARSTSSVGYVKPWFHGIEHLTRDHDGYVYWKSAVVEHFSFQDATKEGAAAEMLASQCRALEASGEIPTSANLARLWAAEAAHAREPAMSDHENACFERQHAKPHDDQLCLDPYTA